MFTDKLKKKWYHEAKIAKIVAGDTSNGFFQCYHGAVLLLSLVMTRHQLPLCRGK